MQLETRIDLIDTITRSLGLSDVAPDTLLGRFSVPLETGPAEPTPVAIAPQPCPASIAAIPPEGYVITEPGTYTLAKNVTWTAAPGATAAITINAPKGGVILDLNDAELYPPMLL